MNWKLPAMAAGTLVLAIGAGAWTGWEAGNDSEFGDGQSPVIQIDPRDH